MDRLSIENSRLSLSLVSYGSDLEELDDSFNETERASPNSLEQATATLELLEVNSDNSQNVPSSIVCLSDDDFIQRVAEKVGLSGISSSQLADLTSTVQKLKIAQHKSVCVDMIHDAIRDVATGGSLNETTAANVSGMLQRVRLMNYVAPVPIHLENDATVNGNVGDTPRPGVWGLTEDHLDKTFPAELSPTDQKFLKLAVENRLTAKHQDLVKKKARSTGMITKVLGRELDNFTKCGESEHTAELIALHRELNREIAARQALMMRLDEVLSSLVDLKTDAMDNINSETMSNFESLSEMIRLHVKALNAEITKESYCEDEHLIAAKKELKQKLDVALESARVKLSQIKVKEMEYEKFKGTHFDAILSKYTEISKELNSKKYALERFL